MVTHSAQCYCGETTSDTVTLTPTLTCSGGPACALVAASSALGLRRSGTTRNCRLCRPAPSVEPPGPVPRSSDSTDTNDTLRHMLLHGMTFLVGESGVSYNMVYLGESGASCNMVY